MTVLEPPPFATRKEGVLHYLLLIVGSMLVAAFSIASFIVMTCLLYQRWMAPRVERLFPMRGHVVRSQRHVKIK
jgi:hypothetical protein